MKLLFSEVKSDYDHYLFPYAIWGIPDPGETPSQFFQAGFLPGSRYLDRFYLSRQIRVDLKKFSPSSENRRIMRKGAGIRCALAPRTGFDFTAERREFCKRYADIKFGKDVMGYARLDGLLQAPVTSHVLVFRDADANQEVGLVTLYLQEPRLAYYYYAFYDLNYYQRNLGMFMMTSAVEYFAGHGFDHLYLGTCYSQTALYKAQFAGSEFFTGVAWSGNLRELKYLVEREQQNVTQHLLETEEYREKFYGGDLAAIAGKSQFQIALPAALDKRR